MPAKMPIFRVVTDTSINTRKIIEKPDGGRFPAGVLPAQQHFRGNRL